MSNSTKIAIVGCGTVGGATAMHLTESKSLIAERYGTEVELCAVVDKQLEHARAIGIDEELLTENLDDVLGRDDIDIVVELVGGIDVAASIISRALAAGKHVVTANKALLAHRGPELFAAAHKADRCLAFEASCAGGIPVIRALYDGLAGSRIDAIYGVVNGTCNYILTEMNSRSISYDKALCEAQEIGLAEVDPSLDVGGHDSAHKIAIMAALAFGRQIDLDAVPVEGIDSLDLVDVGWASRLGYVPKLLAIAERNGSGVSLCVRPSFVPERHPLAWVSGPFNAVSVYSYPTGHTMYYGRGAGGSATAGAVVADIVGIATGAYQRSFAQCRFWSDRTAAAQQNAPGVTSSRFYLRVMVDDQPGMLAELSAHLGSHEISISSVHQDETAEDTPDQIASVVIVTHRANEANFRRAVAEINELEHVHGECVVIAIVDEHPESLILSH